jgi:hypothetical protein
MICWMSTHDTIREERISVLALAETVVAIGLSVWIYFHFSSLSQIAISAALAPFLLLRTPNSTKQALDIAAVTIRAIVHLFYERILSRLLIPTSFGATVVTAITGMLLIILSILLFLVLTLAIKIGVSVYNAATRPVESIAAIPSNWRRVVLCTDSATIPEILAGIEEYNEKDNVLGIFRLSNISAGMIHSDTQADILVLFSFLFLIVVYIPSILYRWSLKCTALLWSPLLYVFKPMGRNENPARIARGIIDLGSYKIARGYAAIVMLLFLCKVYIWLYFDRFADQFEIVPGSVIISSYLVPRSIAVWHIAAVTNACLTWWLYIRATRYLHESNSEDGEQKRNIEQYFIRIFIIRNILAVYTALCILYITVWLAAVIRFPPLRAIIFPWQTLN